jgi:hypothetical protein
MQIVNSLWLGNCDDKERVSSIRSAVHALESIKPSDEVEGMAGAQLLATHNASMECFRRAMIKDQGFESRDCNLKHASKLTKCYADLLNALQKYRGKGQQKVTVEHVHVHHGTPGAFGNCRTDAHPVGLIPEPRDGEQDHLLELPQIRLSSTHVS